MKSLNLESRQIYKRLLAYIIPYKAKLIFVILAMIISASTQPFLAAMMEPLTDGSFINKDKKFIIWVPLAILGLIIIRGFADYIVSVVSQMISQKTIVKVREELFAKYHHLPMITFINDSSGLFMSKILYDVSQISNALTQSWIILIRDSLVVLGLLILLFYYSWLLSLSIVVIAPIIYWIIDKASSKMRVTSHDLQNSMGSLTNVIEEGIELNREVRLYNAEEFENNRLSNIAKSVEKNIIKITRITALNVPLVQVLAAIALIYVLYLATFLNTQESLSVGGFMAYITAMILLFEPIRQITKVNPEIQKGIAAAQSIFDILDRKPEKDQGTKTLSNIQGEIQFKNINFSFDEQKPLFEQFDLTIKAKEVIAIVGESGSGKTTLSNLIARFIEPNQGSILLDGFDIQKIKLKNLRKNLGLVSQNSILFNDTIRSNVAYGVCAKASDKEIIEALKLANIYDFVQAQSKGLDELVGEGGARLSGGQKQRIILARAFLKDAPILILDEASSALDNKTEAIIQQAISRIAKDRTTIIIAHRLTTVQNADRIIVLNQGKIIEQGTHNQLIKKKGHYCQLYHSLKEQQSLQ